MGQGSYYSPDHGTSLLPEHIAKLSSDEVRRE